MRRVLLLGVVIATAVCLPPLGAGAEFRVALFEADITIPIGHACMGGGVADAREIVDPLWAKGCVLLGPDRPIVLAALDWCQCNNDSFDRWRDALAEAAGTTRQRVMLATVHQHDAPICDLTAQKLLDAQGLAGYNCDPAFHEKMVRRTADALRKALGSARRVTHFGVGQGKVEKVASNRRVVGPDLKISWSRGSASGDLFGAPEGEIDPWLKTISFWDGDRAVVAWSCYSVHPMSHYGKGFVSADFPGLARSKRQKDDPQVFQIYFTGCAGDTTAGKYNQGQPENRAVLADRLYQGMAAAWRSTKRLPLEQAEFRSAEMRLPPRDTGAFTLDAMRRTLADPKAKRWERISAALGLSWRERVAADRPIDVPCLDLGAGRALFCIMPAESFVGYQLQAQQLRPDSFVMTAGFGDGAPGYIPTDQCCRDGYQDHYWWTPPLVGQTMIAAMAQALGVGARPTGGEALYNGIELARTWPPAGEFRDAPLTPPYLVAPPKVIPIDVGRQLLVDDFLIERTTLRRTFHKPQWNPGNPLLKPDRPWEMTGAPYAMPFSDGVWYDPSDKTFKMWYFAARGAVTCCATSRDGLKWEKPAFDVEPGTNIVLRAGRDSSTVWLDPAPRNPGERFKMAVYKGTFKLYRSPDGIHWTKVSDGAQTGDRSTFFYNPFRQRWVYSIRSGSHLGRSRHYWETTDFFAFAAATKPDWVPWIASDLADSPRTDLRARPQLYNLDCVAYESLFLGLFSIWRGDYRSGTTPEAKELLKQGRPKQNSLCVGFSRDGFHWDRPDRTPWLATSEKRGDWNWGNLQSTAPGCLVVGDRLWFYVSGRAGKSFPDSQHVDAGASTGLATLRRDGFASMDAADEEGMLETRPLRFSGKHLFVNADAGRGQLLAEALDAQGRPIEPFTRTHCRALSKDSTRAKIAWTGAADLSKLAGQSVRFRFWLTRASLFAFWVSPDASGASRGYVAGGGPDLPGPIDTVVSGTLRVP